MMPGNDLDGDYQEYLAYKATLISHLPAMRADLMFSESGVNGRGHFCIICDLRIEDDIHNVSEGE